MDFDLKNWDHRKNWVGHDSPKDFLGRFITGETTIVAVGQPVFEDNTDLDSIQVVGMTQSIGVRQGKQVARIFELGSRGNVLVPGRGAGSLGLARIVFHGPTLMKAMYPNVTEEEINAMYRKPGYGDAFFNLQSELMNDPVGLFMMMYNTNNELYAGLFFEVCYINSHSFNMTSGSNVEAEQIGLMYQDIYPIDPGAVVIED